MINKIKAIINSHKKVNVVMADENNIMGTLTEVLIWEALSPLSETRIAKISPSKYNELYEVVRVKLSETFPEIKQAEATEKYKPGTYKFGRCLVMVAIEAGKWHLSISTRNASPSYNEIKAARYKYLPDNIEVAQIFPSSKEFVNLHPFCHHLFQI